MYIGDKEKKIFVTHVKHTVSLTIHFVDDIHICTLLLYVHFYYM